MLSKRSELGAWRDISDFGLLLPVAVLSSSTNASLRHADLLIMERTVREHIEELQTRLNALNFALMHGHKPLAERNRIESEIRDVTLALQYFHAALLAEQNISKEK